MEMSNDSIDSADSNDFQGQPVPVLGTNLPAPRVDSEDQKSKTNLIINYLPPKMTEEELKSIFTTIGTVQSVKIVKNKTTRDSMGYAFVNYGVPEHADRAVKDLNGLQVGNKSIKVTYARPSGSNIKNANLYVAHIPKHWNTAALESIFSPYGHIIQSKVLTDEDGKSRGCGFVRFDQNAEAEAAISALNGQLPPGSTDATLPLVVKFANTQGTALPTNPLSSVTTIPTIGAGVIGQIPTVTAIQVARPKANSIGPVKSSMQQQGVTRFNPLAVGTSTVPAVPNFQHTTIPGLVLSQQGIQTWCLFVYNLPQSAEDTTLYQLFSPFGAISGVKVMKDQTTNKPKGFGFVNMLNYDEAVNAIQKLNGTQHDGKVLQVSFKTSKK